MSKIKRISFVWNADFSIAGGIRALKEVVSGHHSCTLCEIAYHRVTQTGDWKAYKKELIERLGADISEPCRNQLGKAERAAAAGDFPAVLVRSGAGVRKLLGSTDINGCNGDFAAFRKKLDAALGKMIRKGH
ncbi:MAG TPA: hypothetical protein VLI06_01390 [Solimonas sp.]|nr:hypothetical protein [Solimonas sp.]